MRTLLASLAAALLAIGLGGCKSELYRDQNVHFVVDHETKDTPPSNVPFVGIVLRKDARSKGAGVKVERVLRDSPADKAGVRGGDTLVRFGAQAVNSAADVGSILKSGVVSAPPHPPFTLPAGAEKSFSDFMRKVSPTSHVELTVSREGEQFVLPADLRSREDYESLIKDRIESHMQVNEARVEIPFLFDYRRLEVQPEIWLAYKGRRVREPVVLYRDVDLVPLIGIFSLFRLERMPVVQKTRVQVATWPLVFTSRGKYDKSIEEDGEDAFRAY